MRKEVGLPSLGQDFGLELWVALDQDAPPPVTSLQGQRVGIPLPVVSPALYEELAIHLWKE